MKRYGSRRNDNEYGDRAPVHGAKSSRARAKRAPGTCPWCSGRGMQQLPDGTCTGWCLPCGATGRSTKAAGDLALTAGGALDAKEET